MLLALWLAGSIVAGGSLDLAAVFVLPLTVVVAKAMGLYDRDATRLHKDTLDELPTLLTLATIGALVIFLGQRVLATEPLDQVAIASLWVALFGFLVLGRTIARGVASRATPPERCLVVGREEIANEFATKLLLQGANAELVSIVEPESVKDLRGDPESLVARLMPLIKGQEIHRVVFASGLWEGDELVHAIGDLSAVGVKVERVAADLTDRGALLRSRSASRDGAARDAPFRDHARPRGS